LRSGREFGAHGAIILDDFDVLQHLHAARAKPSDAENASDDHPITVPAPATPASSTDKRDRPLASHSREQSPPRRSSHLAPPVDKSVDRGGRTRAAHRASEQARLGTPLKRVVRKHVDNAQPIHITTTPDNYPVTSTGWSGIREKVTEQREYTIAELQHEHGMSVVHWDGRYVSTPLFIAYDKPSTE
jgi:hypothetical protein